MIYALTVLWAQEAPKGGPEPNPLFTLLPFILIIAVFYFLVILPARRREKAQRELLFSSLKRNDEVLTSSGIFGVVANIKDDEVTLKMDDGARIRMLRSSIVKIINPKEPAPDADAIKAGAPPAKG